MRRGRHPSGRGLAIELARRGAKLGLLARGVAAPKAVAAAVGARRSTDLPVATEPSPRLLEVAAEIEQVTNGANESTAAESTAARTVLLPADVRDATAVKAAADHLREEFGKIDVLIAIEVDGQLSGAAGDLHGVLGRAENQ